MIKVAKKDTIRLPSWWKLLPIGEYVHSSKTTGFTITKEDKTSKPAQTAKRAVRKATRRPVRKAAKKSIRKATRKITKKTVKRRR